MQYKSKVGCFNFVIIPLVAIFVLVCMEYGLNFNFICFGAVSIFMLSSFVFYMIIIEQVKENMTKIANETVPVNLLIWIFYFVSGVWFVVGVVFLVMAVLYL